MGKHVVIIGGGFAGLSAAAALSPHVKTVTILEQDQFPTGPEFRGGVPQARQQHVMLSPGIAALRELFPHFAAALRSNGITPIGVSRDIAWHTTAGWALPLSTPHEVISCDRALLDWIIRCQIVTRKNIRIVDNARTIGFIHSPDRTSILGVCLDGQQPVLGDYFIDATGRQARATAWLSTRPSRPVDLAESPTSVRYTSRIVGQPTGLAPRWRGVIASSPNGSHRAQLLPFTADMYLLSRIDEAEATGSSWARGTLPPLDQLLDPADTGELADRERMFTFRTLRRRTLTPHAPPNFVAMGDAACTLNPAYARGMMIAAQSALALGELCARMGFDAAYPQFPTLIAEQTKTAWHREVSRTERNPAEGNVQRLRGWLLQCYSRRLIDVARSDAVVRSALIDIHDLAASPSRLLRPDIALRTALGSRRARTNIEWEIPTAFRL